MTSAEELKMLAAKLVAMLNDEQGQGMATWKMAVCSLISQLAKEVGLDDQLREEGMQQERDRASIEANDRASWNQS